MPIIVLLRKNAPPIKIRVSEQRLLSNRIVVNGEIWEFRINGRATRIVNILIDNEHAIVLREEETEEEKEVRRLWKKERVSVKKRIFHCLDPEIFPDLIDQAIKISDLEQKYRKDIEDLTKTYEKRIAKLKEIYENIIDALMEHIDDLGRKRVSDKIKAIVDESLIYDNILNKLRELQQRRLLSRVGIGEEAEAMAESVSEESEETSSSSESESESGSESESKSESEAPPYTSPLRRVSGGEDG